MPTELTGAGDHARSMALLWRAPETSAVRRGARSSPALGRIVAAGVELADAEGLSAVSMRRVAAQVGVPVMTLYGHVPGKRQLVELMLDAVLGELYPDEQVPTAGNWRARVEAVARANRQFHLRHPWALETGQPPPGPNLVRKYELELRAVDGLGLSDVQMDLLVTLINGFVRGSVSALPSRAAAGGTPERPRWPTTGPYAAQVLDPARFPTAARVAPAADEELQGTVEHSFEFGLERLLDGIGVLILNPSR